MENRKPNLTEFDEFHEHNLFLPTRTIYFGGQCWNEDSDEINTTTVAELIKNLHILEHREIAPISILLQSCGGNWESGIAVYDLIRTLQSEVTIIGCGKVYSMATVILQAAKKRILFPNTCLLCHDGSEGFVGETKNFEIWGKHSEYTRKIMYSIYYERMIKKNRKLTLKDVELMCEHDKIITAPEAIKLGLADRIINYV